MSTTGVLTKENALCVRSHLSQNAWLLLLVVGVVVFDTVNEDAIIEGTKKMLHDAAKIAAYCHLQSS